MNNYDNTNRGSLWGNDDKQSETSPDFKGSINIEGKEYWLSAWRRKPSANPKAPALSMSVQPKEEKQAAPQQTGYQQSQAMQQPAQDNYEDDIPF